MIYSREITHARLRETPKLVKLYSLEKSRFEITGWGFYTSYLTQLYAFAKSNVKVKGGEVWKNKLNNMNTSLHILT